jgi:hypothetical protein
MKYDDDSNTVQPTLNIIAGPKVSDTAGFKLAGADSHSQAFAS